MRNRLIVITFITGLLVTGCSSGMSLEEKYKLAEYKACLETRGLVYATSPYIDNKNNAVEIALDNCKKYKP
jgi:uncharacterized protein YceK